MKKNGIYRIVMFALTIAVMMVSVMTAKAASQHPEYLTALADLRAARWLIDHHPSITWVQSTDEANAIKAIDAAIDEINKAGIDDGKDIDDHAKVQEIPDRGGRLRRAIELFKQIQQRINEKEDDSFAHGLRGRIVQHIDLAIRFTNKAIMSR